MAVRRWSVCSDVPPCISAPFFARRVALSIGAVDGKDSDETGFQIGRVHLPVKSWASASIRLTNLTFLLDRGSCLKPPKPTNSCILRRLSYHRRTFRRPKRQVGKVNVTGPFPGRLDFVLPSDSTALDVT